MRGGEDGLWCDATVMGLQQQRGMSSRLLETELDGSWSPSSAGVVEM